MSKQRIRQLSTEIEQIKRHIKLVKAGKIPLDELMDEFGIDMDDDDYCASCFREREFRDVGEGPNAVEVWVCPVCGDEEQEKNARHKYWVRERATSVIKAGREG